MASLLVVTGLIQLFACATFAYTAYALAVRSMQKQDTSAGRGFIAWWGGMSFYMGITGVLAIAASFGWHPVSVFMAFRLVVIPAISLAAGGLTYYVLYLYTGKASLRYVVAAYYAVVGSVYMTASYLGGATSVEVTPWSAALTPRTPNLDLIYALFGLPAIVSAIAYLSLAFRPLAPMQRYRIVLVALSILGWVVSGIVTSALRDPFLIFLGITFFGIVTAFAVLFAYRPPGAVRRWLDARATARRIIAPAASQMEPPGRFQRHA